MQLPFTDAQETDIAYPALTGTPNAQGLLPVSENPPHSIHWEEWGNPQGEPLVIVHGGPGGGISPAHARIADPSRYRIILFDQRGCGKSVPHAANDPVGGMAENHTTASIGDMEQLRARLGIEGKMHVYGGSWGTTLGLAYAQAHPENVASLVLRGIFLCDEQDLSFFYQGNAATYASNPDDLSLPGAYRAYKSTKDFTVPEHLRDERMAQAFHDAWDRFVNVIPEEERGNMVAAYNRRFTDPSFSAEERNDALRAWTNWEDQTSYLNNDLSQPSKLQEEKVALAFAQIENGYFHRALTGGDPAISKLLDPEELKKLINIPIRIVQGAFDQVCVPASARKLVAALEDVGAKHMIYKETTAGHALMERETYTAVREATDDLPKLKEPWVRRTLNADQHLNSGMGM